MLIVQPRYSIEHFPDFPLEWIEQIARTCYKSEEYTTQGSAEKLVEKLVGSGHHAMLEHASATVRFICSRGVSHELVRHRLASFAQESTRFCNYAKDRFNNQITVIEPAYVREKSSEIYVAWKAAMKTAESCYLWMLDHGVAPQQARGCLPIDLKTEVVVTANLREWMHIFKLRTSPAAHPEMVRLMRPLANNFGWILPVLFGQYADEGNSKIPAIS